MGHEHQRSDAGINWNKTQIYKDLKKKGWDHETVDRNLFVLYEQSRTNTSRNVDSRSIMMYPIPKEWTLDKVEMPLNDDLSQDDITFIHAEYA
jgi:hypothetical protein